MSHHGKLRELVRKLSADVDLQRDLKNPAIFAALVASGHDEVPNPFRLTFEKLLQLQLCCEEFGEEFSIELITPQADKLEQDLQRAKVLDFTPQPQVRSRRQQQASTSFSPQQDDGEGNSRHVAVGRPSICSWQVVIATLCTAMILFLSGNYTTTTTETTTTKAAPPSESLPPTSRVLQEFNVDICEYPFPIRHHDSNNINNKRIELTIGDLHGNAIKLVYFLIKEGVLLGVSSSHYLQLCTAYHTAASSSSSIKLFNDTLLHNANVTIAPQASSMVIRLLGDEFADRGQNDMLTLLVFEKILQQRQQGVRLEVLLSNHGFEFYSYDQDDKMRSVNLKLMSNLKEHREFSKSLHAFHAATTTTKSNREQAKRTLDLLYAHSLKLISYNMDALGNVLVFTHAPIGLETLALFANEFALQSNSEDKDICKTIDSVAVHLVQCLELIQAKFDRDIKHRIFSSMRNSKSLMQFIWRRNAQGKASHVLTTRNGAQVRWVHGHDGFEVQPKKYGYCMDDEFGKQPSEAGLPQVYSVLVSRDVE